ncbi:MAG: C40 family peptidase [Silanimonas sp.]
MNGRDALPRHYPAAHGAAPSKAGLPWPASLLLAGLLAALAGCASVGERDDASAGSASEPRPLRSPYTSAPKPLDLRADDVLMQAMGLIGTPYRFGGTTPQRGFDCSGFTSYVFRESVGLQLPRTANDQFAGAGTPVDKDALSAGDLVFFQHGRGRIDHVGIYVGEGRFIHSPSRGGRVRIDALAAPYWTRRYHGARRLLGNAP